MLDILYGSSHARKVLFKSHNQIIILLRINFYSLAEKSFEVITFSVYSSLLNSERSVVFSFLYRENYQLFGPRRYWVRARTLLTVHCFCPFHGLFERFKSIFSERWTVNYVERLESSSSLYDNNTYGHCRSQYVHGTFTFTLHIRKNYCIIFILVS